MLRSHPKAIERLEMHRPWVPFVLSETETWKPDIQLLHFPIPRYLYQNRGSTDCLNPTLTLDHGLGWPVPLRAPVPIHKNILRGYREPFNGPRHGQHGRLVDVQLVNFAGLASTQAPGSRILQDILVRSEEHTSELQSRPHLVC